MKRCRHRHTRQVGADRCYSGSVAAAGDENRAAHGGITCTVECTDCGARRDENHNQGHAEVSPWRRPDGEAPATASPRGGFDLCLETPDHGRLRPATARHGRSLASR